MAELVLSKPQAQQFNNVLSFTLKLKTSIN
jgi:hypothetical protein